MGEWVRGLEGCSAMGGGTCIERLRGRACLEVVTSAGDGDDAASRRITGAPRRYHPYASAPQRSPADDPSGGLRGTFCSPIETVPPMSTLMNMPSPRATAFLLCGVLFLSLAACDTTDDDDEMLWSTDSFVTLNANVVDEVVDAEVQFTRDDGLFEAVVLAEGLAPDIQHAQHVHAEGTCPPASADANNDGFIDVVEGLPFYGAILIPLDGDLSEQVAGADGFPVANAVGQVTYEETADFSDMLDNLQAEDPDTEDPFVKLTGDDDLDLGGRTVVLHGVPASTDLPETVQSIAGLPAHATLPGDEQLSSNEPRR